MGDGKIISIDDVRKKMGEDKEVKDKQDKTRALKKKMGQIATFGDVIKAHMQINELHRIVDNDFIYTHAVNRLLMRKRWWRRLFRRSVLTKAEIEAEIKKIVEERKRNAEQQMKKMAGKNPPGGPGQTPDKAQATPKPPQGQPKPKESA